MRATYPLRATRSKRYARGVTLHHLAERFSAVAARYESGRPDYPPAVVGAIAAELRVPPGGTVLDLGAGTGKLTRALVAEGCDAVAIEPQPALREAIPLPDRSVDAITVADAFHWFDGARALPEMARVLRDGGGIAVITTGRDWREASWGGELAELITHSRPEHPFFDGESWQQELQNAGGWEEPWDVRLVVRQPSSAERIIDHIASFSWIAAMEEAEREQMLGRMREIIQAGETPELLAVNFYVGLSRRA
jgi:SAM-dependent methyltransferase